MTKGLEFIRPEDVRPVFYNFIHKKNQRTKYRKDGAPTGAKTNSQNTLAAMAKDRAARIKQMQEIQK